MPPPVRVHGAKFFGGPVRYVMAGSGHIAGVVNPPGKPKYQSGGADRRGPFDLGRAAETPGSWWPDWIAWLADRLRRKSPLASRARESSKRWATRRGICAGEVVTRQQA